MAEKTSDSGAGKLTQLPVARIKTIMKSSPDLPHFSQESVFLVTKATVSCVRSNLSNKKYASFKVMLKLWTHDIAAHKRHVTDLCVHFNLIISGFFVVQSKSVCAIILNL